MRSQTCPKCQGKMAEGFLLDATYGANKVGQWFEGIPQIGFLGSVKLRGRKSLMYKAGVANVADFSKTMRVTKPPPSPTLLQRRLAPIMPHHIG
jgi:hypothetical protein